MHEMRLEAIVLPVEDVDRGKTFYEKAGFVSTSTTTPESSFEWFSSHHPDRPVRSSSEQGRARMTGAPGQGDASGGHDIEAAVAERGERGTGPDQIVHMTPEGTLDGPNPDRTDYASYSGFTTPRATAGDSKRLDTAPSSGFDVL